MSLDLLIPSSSRAEDIALAVSSAVALLACLLGAVVLVCGTLTRARTKQPVLDLSVVATVRGALLWGMGWWGAAVSAGEELLLPERGNAPWYLIIFACSAAGFDYARRTGEARGSSALRTVATGLMWGLPAVGGALAALAGT